jgi:hypothetical protein
VKFYLGTHKVSPPWWALEVPLFVSRRTLFGRQTLPRARVGWALDSGGFSELDNPPHAWRTTPAEYVRDVRRFEREIGLLEWVAPQDWMVEPTILEKTGLTVAEHQRRTVGNFLVLRFELEELVVPVLQGWSREDYLRCWQMYEEAGVDLEREPLVGLGSVCRRQGDFEAGRIVRALRPLRLHYFGAKLTGLQRFADALASADSLAWSYRARRDHPLPGCPHKSCSNCPRYASRWRAQVMHLLAQGRLDFSEVT